MRSAFAILIFWVAGTASAQDLPVKQVNWRYDENWSVLRGHPVANGPWWLPAKYQSLNDDGSVWLSTGLEARARYEGFQNNDWGSADAPDDGYLWLRLMPHADLHAGPLRAFVQGIAGYAIGVAGGAGPVDKTGIDLLQGFADFRLPLRDDVTVTLRGGRELVALGSERLVGTRYGPNVPQPFDGVRGLVKIRGVNINVFHLRPVRIGPHNFDDKTDSSRRLSGVYATLPLKIGTAAGLDVYFLDYHRNIATFDQGAAKENRRTWGTRFFGRAGNWSWNWEGMVQGGTFGPARIRAWSIATETSHIFPDVPLKPKVRLRADIASGDKNPADPDLGTFNPLFPKGKYFGELSPIGPYNIINVNPNVDLDLGKGFVLGIASVAYWRQSRRDGVYDIPGHLIRSGAGSQARFIGVQGEAVLSWQADPALSMAASFSLFKPGRFIEETGPSRMIRMIGLETMYRF